MNNKFLTFFLFFISLWFVLSFFTNGKNGENGTVNSDIEIASLKKEWVTGQLVTFTVKNNLTEDITLGETQNPPESLVFEQWFNGKWEKLDVKNSDLNYGPTIVAPGQKLKLTFSEWNNDLFDEVGKYRLLFNKGDQEFTAELELAAPGVLRSIWRTVFFKPIFNVLIFFVSKFPGHNLALAILALTILIKVILLGPSKKALLQQQKMQKVQKELDAVRKKHAGDQQKIAQETMALWKKHDVHPLGSFMPMFIQFPVMIALFYVVKEGLLPHNSIFLWTPLKDFDLSLISSNLFGILDLKSVGALWLAIVVGILQFVSMKLTFWHKKKKEEKKDEHKKDEQKNQAQAMNTVMTYGLPVMIGFFTLSMPAAVGFYWGISTLFSIGQQFALNKNN